jgi:hypothetical protein
LTYHAIVKVITKRPSSLAEEEEEQSGNQSETDHTADYTTRDSAGFYRSEKAIGESYLLLTR